MIRPPIYVYVLRNCPICTILKQKIENHELNYMFKFIDETEFIIKKINFTQLSFPQFFYIKNNVKCLLDRTAVINKFLAKEIHDK
jgi:glutaredoxin